MVGRSAATLVDGTWGPGEYEAFHDTRGLPPGVYLARAQAPGGVDRTFRIVLLR